MNPAIIVIAYNRPESLKRLLESIALADYPDDQITLHISIDQSTTHDVEHVAEAFIWNFGRKIIQAHTEHLGLKKHVLLCGDLVQNYESIIVLEDDLAVAPDFYNFARSAIYFYKGDSSIAGVSLYKYYFEEASFQSFQPINDGSDVHFIQVASSWGQMWTKDQWLSFKSWLLSSNEEPFDLPEYIKQWGQNSWKKLFNSYLIEENKFFVFPNDSLSTNFEEVGTNARNTGLFQVPLQIGKKAYNFIDLRESKSKYDEYFEILPETLKQFNKSLLDFNFDVDLYGNKPIRSNHDYRLTSGNVEEYEIGFSSARQPLVQNVIFNALGDDFGLVNLKKYAPELWRNSGNRRLSSLPSNLKNEIIENTKELLTFSVVIIARDNSSLELSLNSIPKSQSIDVVVVGKQNLLVKAGVNYIQFNGDVLQMLQSGFKSAKGNIVTWCFSGDQFVENAFDSVAEIMSTFTNIYWLHGVKEVDLQLSRLEKMDDFLEHTRGTFLKSYMIENALNSDENRLEINTLKYLAVGEFISSNTSVTSSQRNSSNRTSFNILKWGFKRKLPIVSTLYRRKAKLPLVIRYDKIHNSYYLNEF